MTNDSTPALQVGLTFRIDDALIAEIEAVDPRIRVIRMFEISGSQEPDAETKARLLRDLANVEVLMGTTGTAREYFEAATSLRWFQSINAGLERLEREGVLGMGFAVTSGAGIASVAIAEWIVGSMVMLTKNLHVYVRQQGESRWESRRSGELDGKTVGIVGLGAIGRETARRCRAFGMQVIASRRTVPAGTVDPDCDLLVPHSELPRLLAESDYVVLSLPLTAETRGLIGSAELAQMKPTAYLLNVARGDVVDQSALVDALRAGTIAGAALDVTSPEPLPAESELWALPNLILTPHMSGNVEGYGHKAAGVFVANLRRYVTGEQLEHLANPSLGY
ncbi:MAG: D-2-hydroxyacid dehydrogenase [Tepidiformaceae bacterium]